MVQFGTLRLCESKVHYFAVKTNACDDTCISVAGIRTDSFPGVPDPSRPRPMDPLSPVILG